jgi:uncharacterized DUF497 family protein
VADALEGFDWDEGNTAKCAKHGVSAGEIESLFRGDIRIAPANPGSDGEVRSIAIGKTAAGRHVFLVSTIRLNRIRPISARYMHQEEIARYEKDTKETASDA